MGQETIYFKVVYWGYHDIKPNIIAVPIDGEYLARHPLEEIARNQLTQQEQMLGE